MLSSCAPFFPHLSGLWALFLLVVKGSGGWEIKYKILLCHSRKLFRQSCWFQKEWMHTAFQNVNTRMISSVACSCMVRRKELFVIRLFSKDCVANSVSGMCMHVHFSKPWCFGCTCPCPIFYSCFSPTHTSLIKITHARNFDLRRSDFRAILFAGT